MISVRNHRQQLNGNNSYIAQNFFDMHTKRFFLLIIVLGFLFLLEDKTALIAQVQITKSSLIETYNGKSYYIHNVEAKQTLYSIAKVYEVSIDDIEAANPGAKAHLRIGQVLRIPTANAVRTNNQSTYIQTNVSNENDIPDLFADYETIIHVAAKDETFEHISEIYIVNENNIRLANPDLTEPLLEGEYVTVPVAPKNKGLPVDDIPKTERPKYDPYVSSPQVTSQVSKTDTKPKASNSDYKVETVETIMPFSVQEQEKSAAPVQQTPPESTNENSKYQHVVKPNETAQSIATLYNISAEELISLNPGTSSGVKVGMVLRLPAPKQEVQTSVKSTVEEDKIHVVQKGETLYRISRNYGVSIDELRKANPGLTETISIGQRIVVPKKKIINPYFDYEVESQQTVKKFCKEWEITTKEFLVFNPSVGRRVYPGQIVRIPISKNVEITPLEPGEVEPETEIESGETEQELVSGETPTNIKPSCKDDVREQNETYRVALMLPLFLEEVNESFLAKHEDETIDERPFSFLQFYEGFLIAVDSLVSSQGLKLELCVYDVDQSIEKAQKALNDSKLLQTDLIVGPFFSRPFEVVAEFAKMNQILIVNPLSTRSNILIDNPMVVKIKPNVDDQIEQLASLISDRYSDSKIFIIRPNSYTNLAQAQRLRTLLEEFIPRNVNVSNERILQVIRENSPRSSRLISSIKIENQTFYSVDIQSRLYDQATFENSITDIDFEMKDVSGYLERNLSIVRENVLIVLGDDRVFATKFLNEVSKAADSLHTTMIALPEWEKIDRLFIENLILLKAIYFNASNINYKDYFVDEFILKFRNKYNCEPNSYAFDGFDVAWYFLNAFLNYGSNPKDCLPDYQIPLLETNFYFKQDSPSNGLENKYWNIYQLNNYQRTPIPNTFFNDVE